MSDKTRIEWTDATWNPVRGCTEVSPGCDHCYARTVVNGRLRRIHPGGFGTVMLLPDRLDQPLRWQKPRRIFVNSLADLFHDAVPDDYIARVFVIMHRAEQHTFQVLTKRHGRMRALVSSDEFYGAVVGEASTWTGGADPHVPWPLPNVWLGVSVEDQKRADLRIPALLDTPAAVRFLSCEPLLGPINLRPWLADPAWIDGDVWPPSNARERSFDWVIVGGESGHGARPMHPSWARQIRNDCLATQTPGHHRLAGVPEVAFLFKQWGEHTADGLRVGKHNAGRELDGRTWDQYPDTAPAGATA